MAKRQAAARDLFGRLLRRRPLDRNAEARNQAAIVEFVRWCAPDILIWHVPNGGLRSKVEAARLKWQGVLAGVLDLTLALDRGRSAFWETKTDWSDLEPAQIEIIEKLTALGHICAVVRSIDDARHELQSYGVKMREAAREDKPWQTA